MISARRIGDAKTARPQTSPPFPCVRATAEADVRLPFSLGLQSKRVLQEATAVLFVVSPESLRSEICMHELRHAAAHVRPRVALMGGGVQPEGGEHAVQTQAAVDAAEARLRTTFDTHGRRDGRRNMTCSPPTDEGESRGAGFACSTREPD
jgi:hypothetical protein